MIGGAMLLAAARQFTLRRALVEQSVLAPGTVVALTGNRERDEISYCPQVKFRAFTGREITFQSGMGSSANARRIGETVAVRYRTDEPDMAEIDSFMALWGPTLLFAALGLVFLFVGPGILLGRLSV